MKRLILVADGQVDRRRRLADAFRATGAEVAAVGDGAAALELALSRHPAVVVAETELQLVETLKFAEILRANPRNRAARFVFVGDGAESASRGGLSDVFLPGDASIRTIVSAAALEMSTHERLTPLSELVEQEESPRGSFPPWSLVDVMHCLHQSKRSGRLDVRRKGQRGASVWLRDGEIVDAESGVAQGRKALYRMMSWEEGEFELDPSGLHAKRIPLAPLGQVVLEGARQLSEWKRLADELPSLDGPVRLRVRSSELPNILHPLTQEVLSLLESNDRVGDVVDDCSYPDYLVLRTLGTLADRQIIDLSPEAEHDPADSSLFDAQQIRRLNDWACAGPIHAPDADLKVLVAAASAAALSDFAELLRRAPGASLAPDFDSGLADLNSMATLGRLDGQAGVGIELVNVPTGTAMAPLWPVAASEGLGTLFLLSSPVGEMAAAIQPMADALRSMPGSRFFNLFLFHKDEPISPSELSENLSLIDEASLFMLPLEGEKSPLALLRSVFSRVVQ